MRGEQECRVGKSIDSEAEDIDDNVVDGGAGCGTAAEI